MIELVARIKATEEYIGKSKFSFWGDIRPDDVLEIKYNMTPLSRNRSTGLSTPVFSVTNQRTQEEFDDTHNSLLNYLSKLKYTKL